MDDKQWPCLHPRRLEGLSEDELRRALIRCVGVLSLVADCGSPTAELATDFLSGLNNDIAEGSI